MQDLSPLLKDAQFTIIEKELVKKIKARDKGGPMKEQEYLLYLNAYLDRIREVVNVSVDSVKPVLVAVSGGNGVAPVAGNGHTPTRPAPAAAIEPIEKEVAGEGVQPISAEEKALYEKQDAENKAKSKEDRDINKTCQIIIDSVNKDGWDANGNRAINIRGDRTTADLKKELAARGLRVTDLNIIIPPGPKGGHAGNNAYIQVVLVK